LQTELSDHFRFGENWQSFAREVDADRIAQAERGLAKLIAPLDLAGKSFLDVGCGSGLSMLAALRLGAASVHGVDLDPASVEAARGLLTHNAPGRSWSVEVRSVFDLDPAAKRYDIVYSWGVLHHTGAMWRAVDCAASMVAPGGVFVLALYHRTPFCGLWRVEKRIYAHGPRWLQSAIRGVYKAAYVTALTLRGRSARRYIADYSRNRGMKWHHDVHDWLGGYPYESVLPAEVSNHLMPRGFAMERVFENCAGTVGLFGTGCDEFLARRGAAK
jgi:2-polyprenyl-6-hydroxyphenyl methylase/3-demethylubiquinone-9 3-methyltransferase